LFSIYDKILPYGLLTEFLSFYKKNYPKTQLIIDDEVKDFLGQDSSFDNIELEKCEPWDYRPYQEECIRKALKYKKCIIRAATSAGKSYIIAGIIKNLFHSKKISNAMIIVPTTSLVEQFYKDILDYGFYKEDLGRVYSKFKEWDKKIVIST
jgi:superfamily II DNA or RNA helicase